MEYRLVLGVVAPTLINALSGPLSDSAWKSISMAIANKDASEDEVSQIVLKGLDNPTLVKLKKAEDDFNAMISELNLNVSKLNSNEQRSKLDDVTVSAVNRSIFILGVCIICTFSVLMLVVAYGAFQLMTGGIILKDVSAATTVAGLLGTVIGYVAGNAQQVVGYYFGSSKSSSTLSTALAGAIKETARM